jgi:hypothetical protein
MRLARDAAIWGLRFYRRHLWLVFGLSMIPTVQRFVLVRWGDELSTGVHIGTEVLTGAARVLLFYLIIKIGIGADPELGHAKKQDLFGSAVDRHKGLFALQFVILGAAFVLLDILPNAAIALWVPAEQQELVTSIVVAAKNPTVIAFTFLWMAGVARELMLRQRAVTT